jgi:hypothetical protein
MEILTFDKLLKVASKLNVTSAFLRDRYFSNIEFFPEGEIPVEIERGGKKVAPFVAPEIGGKVMEREKRSVTVFEAPEVAPQFVITRKNLIRAEQGVGAIIIEGDNSTVESRKAKLIRDDLDKEDKAITNREEWMASQALFKGQIIVNGDGYTNEAIVFWDQADKPYKELTGTAVWTNAVADPLADIENAIAEVQTRSGYTPTEMLLHPKDWALIQYNEKVLKILDTKNINLGSLNLTSKANEQGVRVVGTLAGLTILTYSQSVVTQDAGDGTQATVELVPEGYVLFANPSVPTVMAYGVVQINDIKNQDIKLIAMKRVPNMYLNNKNPAGIVTETKCAPLPVPLVPDAFYVLKVK